MDGNVERFLCYLKNVAIYLDTVYTCKLKLNLKPEDKMWQKWRYDDDLRAETKSLSIDFITQVNIVLHVQHLECLVLK